MANSVFKNGEQFFTKQYIVKKLDAWNDKQNLLIRLQKNVLFKNELIIVKNEIVKELKKDVSKWRA